MIESKLVRLSDCEFGEWIRNALEIESALVKFGALAIFAQSCFGAIYPQLPSQQTESHAHNVT
jgi:hypothetical protein